MSPNLQAFAVRLSLHLIGFVLGIAIGAQISGDHFKAGQLTQVAQGQQRAAQAVDAGASAVAAVQATAASRSANQSAIDQEIQHGKVAFVRVRSSAGGSVAADADRVPAVPGLDAASTASRSPAPSAATAAAVESPPLFGAADLELTLGAMRLWNSALLGHPVAAGACPADDPAAPACAAGAGRVLSELWANHNLNASLCGQDRSQLTELISLEHARQAIEQGHKP